MPVFCIVLKMNMLKKIAHAPGFKDAVSSERLPMIRGYEKKLTGNFADINILSFLSRIRQPTPRRETCLKFLTDSERKIWFIK